MACFFGHKWNGCTCVKCGKMRDEHHQFEKAGQKCQEKCSICGAVRPALHRWHGCRCEECGEIRDTEHDWMPPTGNECIERCSICGTERVTAHVWAHKRCSRCGAPKPATLISNAEDLAMIDEALAFWAENMPDLELRGKLIRVWDILKKGEQPLKSADFALSGQALFEYVKMARGNFMLLNRLGTKGLQKRAQLAVAMSKKLEKMQPPDSKENDGDDVVQSGSSHYVLHSRNGGENIHVPSVFTTPQMSYTFDPGTVTMTCVYGGAYTVTLRLSDFYDATISDASGEILYASVSDTMKLVHKHLADSCNPLYLAIRQTSNRTEHEYLMDVTCHATYVRFSSHGTDIVGDIDVQKAEIPGISWQL